MDRPCFIKQAMNPHQPQLDLEALRARLRNMKDAELNHFLMSVMQMCTPIANMGQPPREEVIIQLAEIKTEKERRRSLKQQQ